jgi:hypothetical protein
MAQFCSGLQAQACPAALQAQCGPQAHGAAAAGDEACPCWQPQRQLAPGQLVHWQDGVAVVVFMKIS